MFVVSSSSALLSSERYLLDLDDDDDDDDERTTVDQKIDNERRRMCSSTKSKKIRSWIAYIYMAGDHCPYIYPNTRIRIRNTYTCSSFRHHRHFRVRKISS